MTSRTALVHGSDGMGIDAVVRRLTADGFRVVVAGRADLPSEVARAVGESGSLDALVCAVDQPVAATFDHRDPEEWFAAVTACLAPPFRLVRAAVPALRRSGSGRVVLLGSGWTTAERPGRTASGAVHGAVVALVKTLARDLGPDGITVNEIVSDPDGPSAPEALAAAVSYLCGPSAGAVVGQLVTLGTGGALRP